MDELVQLAGPIMLIAGAIGGWLALKAKARREGDKAQWHDDSLDDWRTEREQQREAERQARTESRETPEGVETRDREAHEQQERIGG